MSESCFEPTMLKQRTVRQVLNPVLLEYLKNFHKILFKIIDIIRPLLSSITLRWISTRI